MRFLPFLVLILTACAPTASPVPSPPPGTNWCCLPWEGNSCYRNPLMQSCAHVQPLAWCFATTDSGRPGDDVTTCWATSSDCESGRADTHAPPEYISECEELP